MNKSPSNPADSAKPQKLEVGSISKSADLIVESDVGPEVSEFRPEQSKSINEAVETITTSSKVAVESWLVARKKIESFRPLPWFLWRLSLSVFSKPVGSEEINEGMILGLRRLLFAAASDPILGIGAKLNSVKKALEILPSDVIGAVSVVHSVCRRLKTYGHESVWKPILDEALVQAQIGYELGAQAHNIGKGRALLCGFASQIGFAILIACGDKKQAAETIEKLATGQANALIAKEVYGCEPLQISAMLLAAAGCGPEASNGIALSSGKISEIIELEGARCIWATGCYAIEMLRKGKGRQISDNIYPILGLEEGSIDALTKKAIKVARSGHSWQWIE